jgi:hypothetical protein
MVGKAATKNEVYDVYWKVIEDRDEALLKAWDALAGYKFWMFGYHAATWVKANRTLPHRLRNESPFRRLVKVAREERFEREVVR